jgi:hypothetical protein
MTILRGGHSFYGKALGILMLDMKAPGIPGNVGNANSYDFPVRYKVLKNIPCDWWCDQEGASSTRLKIFVEKAKELEQEGVRAITTGCGFFSVFQNEAAKYLKIPLFSSPLLLVPLVSRMIGENKRVGIIASGVEIKDEKFLQCAGITSTIPIAIGTLEGCVEFNLVHNLEKKLEMDPKKIEQEVITVVKKLIKDYPDIGAIVFECSDIPPYSRAASEAVNLPVFDFISFAHFVYKAVLPVQYEGFM